MHIVIGLACTVCCGSSFIQQKGVFLSLSYLVRKVAESPKKITPGWHLMTVDWKDFCDCTLRENILYHLISSRVKMYNGYSWSCKHLQSTRIWFDCSHWNLSNQYKIHLVNSLNASGVRLRTEKTVSYATENKRNMWFDKILDCDINKYFFYQLGKGSIMKQIIGI